MLRSLVGLGRGVSLHLHVYIHSCTYTVYTCILEAYTVYCTGHMLSKECSEESFVRIVHRTLSLSGMLVFSIKSFTK